jgi:4-amino-4-deoxy-L-arabinose transferase-like glycosyltransferase
MRLPRARFDLVVLAACALATNFLYLHYSSGDFFYPDSITYLTPANNLLHGFGFAVEPGSPDTFRTPGYPIFLLPFLAATSNVLPIVVVQHLLNVGLVLAVYLVARRITGSRPGAFLAGLILVLDVSTIHHANKVLSETLFTCVLFVLFVLVLRMSRRGTTMPLMIVAGAIAGVLVLIRPVAILYFVVPALFLALTENVRRVIAFTVMAILIPLAWGIRNRAETGVFTISSVAATNMLVHRAAPSIAIFGTHEFESDLASWQARLKDEADREIVEREDVRSIAEVDVPVVWQYYGAIGRRIALQHPWGLTLVMIRGVIVNLFESDFESIMMVSTIPSTVIEESVNLATTAVTLLALLGAFALWRKDRAVAALIFATIAYFVVISAGSEAESRFRVPVVPLMAIAAGAGAEAIRQGGRAIAQEA